ncbi:MAG: sigma-54 dependent transcriptional regulator [Candidatus Kapaibacterium sp.]|nr:sigma-54-dependent Fis family transcriptional regulator [Ignavibacteriota bacterium]MCB9221099.1 sigma-54-dependent Fis family transcriptional regulator [Ignavibacteria bacterium]
MAKKNYTIAIIEDDKLVSDTVSDILSESYSKIQVYNDAKLALDEIGSLGPDLVLLDIFLGHANGLDILETLRNEGFKMPVIMMTAFSDIKMAVRAMKLGAEDFIVKPLDLEQLELSVEKALDNHDLRRKVDILSEQLSESKPSEIIGKSEGLRKAMEMGKLFAKAENTTVLILGESGTGKELMARHIHDNSPRAKGPFVTINCGAIPRELAENELFGYEKGAFTGATEKVKQGRFEQANHGTILLDEVGELSLDLQVKLLRVLQEKKYYRLGGSKELSVDVRVIAATNRDLEEMVEENEFREDLYYRLNVASITLPPLRERNEDILLLASNFVEKFNKSFGKDIKGFSPEAAHILQKYHWKGNIRELTNVIERIVLLEQEDIITKESLNFLRIDRKVSKSKDESPREIYLNEGEHFLKISDKGAPMGNIVKDLIHQTLLITKGNQIKAAKILGISRAKLRYRLEQLDIDATSRNYKALKHEQ